MGSIKRAEWITASVVIFSVIFWAADSVHHLPSFLIGMFGMTALALGGIIRDEDIGGVFSLANMIQEYKITNWAYEPQGRGNAAAERILRDGVHVRLRIRL